MTDTPVARTAETLVRHTCYYRDQFGHRWQVLSERDSAGEWVRYEDVEAEIERLRLENQRLQALFDGAFT